MPKNSSIFKKSREEEMLATFYSIIRGGTEVKTFNNIIDEFIKTPSSRFWVSTESVVREMHRHFSGKPLRVTLSTKKLMYSEIIQRVTSLLERNPHLPLIDAVESVIYQPAPSFYISRNSAVVLLCRIRNNKKKEKYA